MNNDELGMAAMVKADEVTHIDRTSDINFYELGYKTVHEKKFSQVISETYYMAQRIANDTPARHYFFSVWGLENPKWKEINEFKKYISDESEKLNSPVAVTIK